MTFAPVLLRACKTINSDYYIKYMKQENEWLLIIIDTLIYIYIHYQHSGSVSDLGFKPFSIWRRQLFSS